MYVPEAEEVREEILEETNGRKDRGSSQRE